MIKMANSHQVAKPLQSNVFDFEWGGQVGLARYPHQATWSTKVTVESKQVRFRWNDNHLANRSE
jgi:hypothetical protein